jgi:hypothetical protein
MTYSASVDLIEQPTKSETSIDSLELVPTDEPAWIAEKRPDWGEKLVVAEWEDRDHFRAKNGWKVRYCCRCELNFTAMRISLLSSTLTEPSLVYISTVGTRLGPRFEFPG